MLELKEAEFQFKHKGKVHTMNELSVKDLEVLEKKALTEGYTEMKFLKDMLLACGLSVELVEQLTIRQMKQITEAYKEAK